MHQFPMESGEQGRSYATCPHSPSQDSEPWLWMPRPTHFPFLHMTPALPRMFLISCVPFASQVCLLLFLLCCPSQICNPSLPSWTGQVKLGRGYEEDSTCPVFSPCSSMISGPVRCLAGNFTWLFLMQGKDISEQNCFH